MFIDEMELTKEKLKGTPKQKIGKVHKSQANTYSNSSSSKSSKEYKVAKSSIHFAKVNYHAFKHNAREEEKTSETVFEEYSHENECDVSSKEALNTFNELYKTTVKKSIARKKPDKKNTLWEAVVNIKKEHTLKDLQELAKKIEEKTSFTTIQVSIHKDEGQERDGKLIRKNHHAHLTFFTLNQQDGRQMYRREHMTRQKLSELQDLTAEHLGMERGERGSKAKRMHHKAYKQMKQQEEQLKEQILKHEMKIAREELKQEGAQRKDYAKLEQLNKDLKVQIKDSSYKIEDLQKDLEKKIQTIKSQNEILDSKDNQINEYKNERRKFSVHVDGSIMMKRVKIKKGLFKSEEQLYYEPRSVEAYVKNTKKVLEKQRIELDEKVKSYDQLMEKYQELKESQELEKTLDQTQVKTLDKQKHSELKRKFANAVIGKGKSLGK